MHLKSDLLRVATYNIHKGVRGVGPRRRLEIHNLGSAVEQLDADIVCLQEVRKEHRRQEHYFTQWPDLPQADFLAPDGYEAVYRTNAHTRHGEHGNALLTRWPVVRHGHVDVSDHRFEQRGLLHAEIAIGATSVHVVVVHLGLIASSRRRQTARLAELLAQEVPSDAPVVVAGDFNDWQAALRPLFQAMHLQPLGSRPLPTFPSRLPIVQLDYMYTRGLQLRAVKVPRGPLWSRMSDHLPMVAEFSLQHSPVAAPHLGTTEVLAA